MVRRTATDPALRATGVTTASAATKASRPGHMTGRTIRPASGRHSRRLRAADADAAAPSQAQGYAGGGMRTDPIQSSTPSSATDASVTSSELFQGQRARRDLDGRDVMNQTVDPRSVPQLLSDVARELTTLFRKEGQLIRAELSEKATQLQVGAGSVLAGAICLLAALMVLLQAVVIGLTNAGLESRLGVADRRRGRRPRRDRAPEEGRLRHVQSDARAHRQSGRQGRQSREGASSMSPSARQIEREVEASRANLEETVEALKGKMSLGQMVDEAAGYFKDSGGGEIVANLGRQMRDNPLPLALVGLGLAWLMSGRGHPHISSHRARRLRRPATIPDFGFEGRDYRRMGRDGPAEHEGATRYDSPAIRPTPARPGPRRATDGASGEGLGDMLEGAGDGLSRAAHDARDAAAGVASGIRSAAGTVASAAGAAAGAVGSAASGIGSAASRVGARRLCGRRRGLERRIARLSRGKARLSRRIASRIGRLWRRVAGRRRRAAQLLRRAGERAAGDRRARARGRRGDRRAAAQDADGGPLFRRDERPAARNGRRVSAGRSSSRARPSPRRSTAPPRRRPRRRA